MCFFNMLSVMYYSGCIFIYLWFFNLRNVINNKIKSMLYNCEVDCSMMLVLFMMFYMFKLC